MDTTVYGCMVEKELDRLEKYQGRDADLRTDWRSRYDDVSDLHLAAFYGDMASVERITKIDNSVDKGTTHGPKLLTQRPTKGGRFGRGLVGFFLRSTPLMMACQQGHVAVIHYLTERCNSDVNAVDSLGLTSLSYATSNGHVDVVKYLLASNAVVNTQDKRFGMTSIILAGLKNQTEMVKVLLKRHANHLLPDFFGRTAIHYAGWNYNTELVECLNEQDFNGMGIHTVDHMGNTPLHMLVHDDNLFDQSIRKPQPILVSENLNLDKDTRTAAGVTGILYSRVNNCGVENGQNEDNASHDDVKQDTTVKQPLQKSSDFTHKVHFVTTNNGTKTRRRNNARNNHFLKDSTDAVDRGTGIPSERYTCLKKMLEIGADINVRNKAGQTVLHVLCSSMLPIEIRGRYLVPYNYSRTLDQLVMLKLLVLSGCDPDVPDNTGHTAAMLCAERGNLLALELVEKSQGRAGTIATRRTDMKTLVTKYGWGRLVETKRFKEDVDFMATAIFQGDENDKKCKLAQNILTEALSVL